jgi:hypothetical protein
MALRALALGAAVRGVVERLEEWEKACLSAQSARD